MGRVETGWRDGRRTRKAVYGRTRQAVAEKIRKAKYDLDSDEVKQYLQLAKLRDAGVT